jgi:NADH:ubiquinone oxidoreductase subunit H
VFDHFYLYFYIIFDMVNFFLAETSHTPFDFADDQSELVSGFSI